MRYGPEAQPVISTASETRTVCFGPFHADHRLQEVRRHMMHVSNERGGETVVGQLWPERILVPVQLRLEAVAQVGAQPRAGQSGGVDGRRRGVVVAERNGDRVPGEHPDELGRTGPRGRKGDVENTAAGGPLKPLEVRHGRWADMVARVRTTRAIVGRDPRPFKVNARDSTSNFRVLHRLGQHAAAVLHGVQGAGDQGRHPAGDAPVREQAGDGEHVVHSHFAALERKAARAIDLDVEEGGRQQGIVVAKVSRPRARRGHAGDAAIHDGDIHRCATLGQAATNQQVLWGSVHRRS
jgi:hypothetical protein